MSLIRFKTSDEVNLAIHFYPAPTEKRAVLFLSGVESHGGWYQKSLSHLQQKGITSYFLDRRGSGLSDGTQGDLESVDRLVQDLREVSKWLSARHVGEGLTLSAISWGAKWALSFWFSELENPFTRLVLITPGLFRKVDLDLLSKIRALYGHYFSPQIKLPIPIPIEFFTRDQKNLSFLESDPNRLHQVTARFAWVNYQLEKSLGQKSGIYPQPVALLQADQDKIVDNQKNEEYLRKRFFDLTIKNYPEAYHTLEFENNCSYAEDLESLV